MHCFQFHRTIGAFGFSWPIAANTTVSMRLMSTEQSLCQSINRIDHVTRHHIYFPVEICESKIISVFHKLILTASVHDVDTVLERNPYCVELIKASR
jgi:hypothetical protein